MIIKQNSYKHTFSSGNDTSLQVIHVQAIGIKSNVRTIFISCRTEKSLLYLSAKDFSRNMIWKIVYSLYIVRLPIVCSSSDTILYEWLVA